MLASAPIHKPSLKRLTLLLSYRRNCRLHPPQVRLGQLYRDSAPRTDPGCLGRQRGFIKIKKRTGASLVAQWLRVCLLMQGTRVRAPVREGPTYRGAAGPVSHGCWACASGACAPQRERPVYRKKKKTGCFSGSPLNLELHQPW